MLNDREKTPARVTQLVFAEQFPIEWWVISSWQHYRCRTHLELNRHVYLIRSRLIHSVFYSAADGRMISNQEEDVSDFKLLPCMQRKKYISNNTFLFSLFKLPPPTNTERTMLQLMYFKQTRNFLEWEMECVVSVHINLELSVLV